jgi:hypothetical protein
MGPWKGIRRSFDLGVHYRYMQRSDRLSPMASDTGSCETNLPPGNPNCYYRIDSRFESMWDIPWKSAGR